MKKNLIYFGLISFIVGLVIAFFIFSGLSITGNAKAVTSESFIKSMNKEVIDGVSYINITLQNTKACVGNSENNSMQCVSNIKVKEDYFQTFISEQNNLVEQMPFWKFKKRVNDCCMCWHLQGEYVDIIGQCICGGDPTCPSPNNCGPIIFMN